MASTTMRLVVFIDEKLLDVDDHGNGQLASLTLARKVGGVANVIFQSKPSTSFSNENLFEWSQAYKIGASQTPPQGGAFIESKTAQKEIAPGYMCDWSKNPPMMPDAKIADAGFLARFPANRGMFGTKGQNSKWYNSIWCSTNNGNYSCIYTDSNTIPGMTYRGYQVENNYQVSWESSNSTPGLFSTTWADPYPFSIRPDSNPAANVKYLSWGYPANAAENDVPQWFDYGIKNPGKHDPVKAGPPSTTLTLASIGDNEDTLVPHSAFAPTQVSFRMDWTASSLSRTAKQENARKLLEYLYHSTEGWLTLGNVYTSDFLSASASLKTNNSFGDYLPGETEGEKVRFFLKGVVANTTPRFAPDVLDWNYEFAYEKTAGQMTAHVLGLSDNLRLIWNGLKQGAASLLASESVQRLAKALQDVLFKQGNQDTIVTYETVTLLPNKTSATTTMKITNLGHEGTMKALQILQDLVQKEGDVKVSLEGSEPSSVEGEAPVGPLGPAAPIVGKEAPALLGAPQGSLPAPAPNGAPITIQPFDTRFGATQQVHGQFGALPQTPIRA